MPGDYFGLPTQSIESSSLKLEYLAKAGPRLVRLFQQGSPHNLLFEGPDLSWPTPYGPYHVHGGHRLWISPEYPDWTYIPDNEGLQVERLVDRGVRLVQPADPWKGIRKSITIRLDGERAQVALVHEIHNDGTQAVELAPWAITQLPLGGVALLPQTSGTLDEQGFLPNRNLALWPYTRWNDPRLELHDDLILIRAQPELPPCKVGYLNRLGWVGYLAGDLFFCKRFSTRLDQTFPDYGSNAEVYVNNRFIELESLGHLAVLEPGQSTKHEETWEIYPIEAGDTSAESLRQVIKSLGLI